MKKISKKQIMRLLSKVSDPEMPFLSIVDLGIVRSIKWIEADYSVLLVSITPTYTACPAFETIQKDIVAILQNNGIANVKIEKILTPVWSYAMLTRKARLKLLAENIALPNNNTICPYCHDSKIKLINEYSSTLCKALYQCLQCKNPFEKFKCLTKMYEKNSIKNQLNS